MKFSEITALKSGSNIRVPGRDGAYRFITNSSDGSKLAVSVMYPRRDNETRSIVQLWDTVNEKLLDEHSYNIFDLSFSKDNQHLVAVRFKRVETAEASSDCFSQSVMFWKIADDKLVLQYEEETIGSNALFVYGWIQLKGVYSIQCSPETHSEAVGYKRGYGYYTIWCDIDTKEPYNLGLSLRSPITAITHIDAQRKIAITGPNIDTIFQRVSFTEAQETVINEAENSPIAINEEVEELRHMKHLSGGKHLAVAILRDPGRSTKPSLLQLWDVNTEKKLDEKSGMVFSMSLSKDGQYLVTHGITVPSNDNEEGNRNQDIKFWSLDEGKLTLKSTIQKPFYHPSQLYHTLECSPDNNAISMASNWDIISYWNVGDITQPREKEIHCERKHQPLSAIEPLKGLEKIAAIGPGLGQGVLFFKYPSIPTLEQEKDIEALYDNNASLKM